MALPVYSPLAAAPLLGPALAKVARTPTPRLAVGYRILPPLGCERPFPFAEWVAARRVHCHDAVGPLRDPVDRPLGANLLLERLLLAGNVGDALPLANRRLECLTHAPCGQAIDLLA